MRISNIRGEGRGGALSDDMRAQKAKYDKTHHLTEQPTNRIDGHAHEQYICQILTKNYIKVSLLGFKKRICSKNVFEVRGFGGLNGVNR